MKSIKYLLGLALTALLTMTACQDDFDAPGLKDPNSTWEANMTIAQLKQMYWQDADNYIDTIGTLEDGSHIYIKGRVCSSDKEGNVFRKFVIQDGTAALAISVYQYNTYLMFRMGQEVVLDVTGMFIGKYAGCVQMGWPSTYLDASQASFMPTPFLEEHIQSVGLPDLAKVDTLEVDRFNELGLNTADLIRLQSRLVKLNNVAFKAPGTPLSSYHETEDRVLVDADGSEIVNVRTSGYSTFWTDITPEGRGDVVGILDYYNGTWQLLLIDGAGIMNFGNPTLPKGSRDNPYEVLDVVERENAGQGGSGWVMGYIVGTVAPGIDESVPVTSNEDIEWGANATLANTLVIAPTPDVNDWKACLVIELPQGSKLQQWGNLRAHPDNLGRQIFLTGSFNKVFGMSGITGNRGTVNEFEIIGLVMPDEKTADFNTFNEGNATSKYGTYTTTSGWTVENSLILAGSTSGDANPYFMFIGSPSTLAPTLNGKVSAPGKLTSPIISGGISQLNFCYGFAYQESDCQFTINIIQNGAVVQTRTVKLESIVQQQVYNLQWDVNVSGDFIIEIVNDSLGSPAGNKGRVSIWDLSWIPA